MRSPRKAFQMTYIAAVRNVATGSERAMADGRAEVENKEEENGGFGTVIDVLAT